MRIVSGFLRGRLIKAPKGFETRPTTDKVREAIYSTIGEKVINSAVLDLFAGSGALGIEAISRGAQEVYFIDNSREAIKIIEDNLLSLDFEISTKVKQISAKSFIENCSNYFDLIFVDAPYNINKTDLVNLIKGIINIMKKEAVIIIEHTKNFELNKHFKLHKVKYYGQTTISYLREEDL